MTINREDLVALAAIVQKNSALQEKLRSSTKIEAAVGCLGEIAASHNIPFNTAAYEALYKSMSRPSQGPYLSDVQMEQVAAGFIEDLKLPQGVKEIFEITGLLTVDRIFTSVSKGVEGLGGPKNYPMNEDPNSPYNPKVFD